MTVDVAHDAISDANAIKVACRSSGRGRALTKGRCSASRLDQEDRPQESVRW
jgi:hypothetical protein